MPFDMIPEHLDFNVEFEPTKVADKKYVVNGTTGEYLGVVGNTFNCADHSDFFGGVHDTITESLSAHETNNMNIKFKEAKNNAWVLMDMTLPNVTARVESDKHSTEVAQRIIALHGIDGSCSNQVFFGAIDFFCTNGMIRGEHDKVRRKNTSNFSMDSFKRTLRDSSQSFYEQSERLKEWAVTPVDHINVRDMLHSLMGSERAGDKMLGLYHHEASVRGKNLWALYSAFTNYATYADERNGFTLRDTGNDTAQMSMFQREHKVAQWVNSPQFKELVA